MFALKYDKEYIEKLITTPKDILQEIVKSSGVVLQEIKENGFLTLNLIAEIISNIPDSYYVNDNNNISDRLENGTYFFIEKMKYSDIITFLLLAIDNIELRIPKQNIFQESLPFNDNIRLVQKLYFYAKSQKNNENINMDKICYFCAVVYMGYIIGIEKGKVEIDFKRLKLVEEETFMSFCIKAYNEEKCLHPIILITPSNYNFVMPLLRKFNKDYKFRVSSIIENFFKEIKDKENLLLIETNIKNYIKYYFPIEEFKQKELNINFFEWLYVTDKEEIVKIVNKIPQRNDFENFQVYKYLFDKGYIKTNDTDNFLNEIKLLRTIDKKLDFLKITKVRGKNQEKDNVYQTFKNFNRLDLYYSIEEDYKNKKINVDEALYYENEFHNSLLNLTSIEDIKTLMRIKSTGEDNQKSFHNFIVDENNMTNLSVEALIKLSFLKKNYSKEKIIDLTQVRNDDGYHYQNIFRPNISKKAVEDICKYDNIVFDKIMIKKCMLKETFSEYYIKKLLNDLEIEDYTMKDRFFLSLYKENVDSVSFLYPESQIMDANALKEFLNWFEEDKSLISNLDLELMLRNKNSIVLNAINIELFERKNKGIFIDKKYVLSEKEQKILWLKELPTILSELRIGKINNLVNLLSIVDVNNIKDLKVEYNILDDEEIDYFQEKFMRSNRVLRNNILNFLFNMFRVKNLEQKQKLSINLMNNSENVFDLDINRLNKLLKESTLDEILNNDLTQLLNLIYANKISIKDYFKIDDLEFWRKVVFYQCFKKENEDKVFKYTDNIVAKQNKKFLIPKEFGEDSLIKKVLNYIEYIQAQPRILHNIKWQNEIFMEAKKCGLILENEQYYIMDIITKEHVEDFINLDANFLCNTSLMDVHFLTRTEELDDLDKDNLIKKLLSINTINYKTIGLLLDKNFLFPILDLKEIKEVSMEEKIDVFSKISEYVLLKSTDVERQLTSFFNILGFMGGRRKIVEYINNNPCDPNLTSELMSCLYYFNSVLLDEDKNRDVIEQLKTFNYIKEKSYNYNYSIFFDKAHNAEGLMRKALLLDSLEKKPDSVKEKKKI